MSFKVSDAQKRRGADGSETGGAAQHLLSGAFDAMAEGVVVLAADNRIRFINRSARRMIGAPDDDADGVSLDMLIATGAMDWTEVTDALETRKKADILCQTPEGRPLLVSIKPLRTADLPDAHTMLVLRDLEVFDHERRRAARSSADNTFRFLTERALRPDFARQRALSTDLDSVLHQGERAMLQGARVVLLGESGAGKTEIAKYLHDFLNEPTAPFVHVNCGAIPDTLFESEMFGYERGAFTGALQGGKQGLIEAADGGTLFLDEVAEIPLTVQAKLLKFLEDGTVQRVGAHSSKQVRVRVVSATNRALAEMVTSESFRRDLYYRLAVIALEVKPLRQTPELTDHLIDRFLQVTNQRRPTRLKLSEACRDHLRRYSFPGNVRELHNLVQHLSVVADRTAELKHLPENVLLDSAGLHSDDEDEVPSVTDAGLKQRVRAFERQLIDEAIKRHGSKRKAADALGVDIGTVVRKTQVKH